MLKSLKKAIQHMVHNNKQKIYHKSIYMILISEVPRNTQAKYDGNQRQKAQIIRKQILGMYLSFLSYHIFLVSNLIYNFNLDMEDIPEKTLTSPTKEQLETPHYRSIVALTFLNKQNKKIVGSGVLISKDLVLTAAHNIYDKEQQFQHVDVKVYLSVDGFAQEKKSYDVESWRYLPGYKTCQQSKRIELGYALLRLKRSFSFGEYLPFLPLALPCEVCLMEKNKFTCLQIFGYPGGYKDNYQPCGQTKDKFILNQYGLAEKDRILLVQPENFLIRYAISTLQGQSGTPVCANNEIIAIHTGSGKKEEGFNVGRLVTADLIDNLQKWSQELNGTPFLTHSTNCSHHIINEEQLLLRDIELREKLPQQIRAILEKTKLDEQLNLNLKGLDAIDVTRHTKLKNLCLNNNKLTTIDLRNNPQLTQLWLWGNRIKAINITRNINLTKLHLQSNQLSAVDLSRNTNLTELSLYNNQLKAVDLTRNINLTHLSLFNNQLAAVDLGSNTNLISLNLNSNQLTSVDLSRNTSLTELHLCNNQLVTLDLISNTYLTFVWLSNNQLREVDLSSNTYLTQLYISNNQLAAVDLSSNHKLTDLRLYDNKLNAATCWYSSQLDPKLQNQRSAGCQITLLYRKEEGKICNKVGTQKIQQYNNQKGDKKLNKYDCVYSFKMVERI